MTLTIGCTSEPTYPETVNHYDEPIYDLVAINETPDTLHFPLDSSTYNRITSINTFVQDGIEYLSAYDRRSEFIVIYELDSQRLVKKISLRKFFEKDRRYQTSVFVANFDSIIIANNLHFHLFDSAGNLKKSIAFVENMRYVKSSFDNTSVPVIAGSKLYTGVRRHVKENSLNELRKWKLMYEYDLNENKASLKYPLPKIYQMNYYGRHYLFTSYCYNNGRFVFSFAADTNVYVTDLDGYHAAYSGKSQFQQTPIQPLTKKILKDDLGFKFTETQGSYDAIYFDPYHKRYLRIFNQKVNEADFESKKGIQQHSIIIFDEQLKIIGESKLPLGISCRQIFFTHGGKILARVNSKDEQAIHFVQLKYNEPIHSDILLTKNQKQ